MRMGLLAWLAAALLASGNPAAPTFSNLRPLEDSVVPSRSVLLSGSVAPGTLSVSAGGREAVLAGSFFSIPDFSLAEGANEIEILAKDAAGQTARHVHHVVADTIAPAVSVESPQADFVTKSAVVDVAGRVRDASNVRVTVAGKSIEAREGRFTVSAVALSEGANEIAVAAVDEAGNRASLVVKVARDSAPPRLALLDGLREIADGQALSRRPVPVVAIADPHLLLQRAFLNGRPFVSGTAIAEDGAYEMALEAEDRAGNRARRTVRFTVDTAAPLLAGLSPADGAVLASARTTVSGASGDATQVLVNGRPARLAAGRFRLDGLALPRGRSVLEIIARDRAGNTSRASLSVAVEPSGPRLAIRSPAAGVHLREPSVAVLVDVAGPAPSSLSVNGVAATPEPGGGFLARVPLAEGPVTLTATAQDRLGRTGTASVQVVADRTPPRVAVSDAGAPLSSGSVLRRRARPLIDVADASAVTTTAFLDGRPYVSGSQLLDEGSHRLEIEATDRAGNTTRRQVSFRVDARPPTLANVRPPSGAITRESAVTVSGDCGDAIAVTVAGVPARVHGGRFAAEGVPLAPGSNALAVVLRDPAGNEARETHRVVRDSAAPTISLSSPAAELLTREGSITVEGNVLEEHLEFVEINGGSATVANGRFRRETRLQEGPNRIRIVARDKAGNSAEAYRDAFRDSTPPSIAVTRPGGGMRLPASTLDVEGIVLDARIAQVSINGAPANLEGARFHSAGVPLKEGENTLTVTATDQAGNSSQAVVKVTRDAKALHVALDRLPPASSQAASLDVSGTVSGGAKVAVSVNGVVAGIAGDRFTARVPAHEGRNTVVVRATDEAGRAGTTSEVVTRDAEAPTLLTSSPADGAIRQASASEVRLVFSEPLDPASFSDSSVAIERESDGARLPTTLRLVGEGREVVLLPKEPLAPAAGYRVLVSAAVTDLAGNRLARAVRSRFETEAASFAKAPELASLPDVLCARSLPLRGQTAPGARVRVTGEVTVMTAVADASGRFETDLLLAPDRLNSIEIALLDSRDLPVATRTAAVSADCGGAPALDSPATALPPAAPSPAAVTQVAPAPDAAEFPKEGVSARSLSVAAGQSALFGEAFDDRTGRPLPGADVKVLLSGGVVPAQPITTVTDAQGTFWILVSPGEIVLEASRTGYTRVVRTETPPDGDTITVFDLRLTPLAAAQAGANGGGQAVDGDLSLTLPAAALPASASYKLAALSPQGLPALSPVGWTPAAALSLDTGAASLATPASASWDNFWGLPPATLLRLARYDSATRRFVNAGTGSFSTDGSRLQASIPSAGSWTIFVADPAPYAPPAPGAGQPLSGVTPPGTDPILSATVVSNPAAVLPTQTAEIAATLTLSAPVPSGYPVEVLVSETLTLLDSSQIQVPSFLADLISVRDGAGRAVVYFRVRPSATAASVALSVGYENLVVKRYSSTSRQGDLIGSGGGTVSGAGGFSLTVPAGALTQTVPVRLLPLASSADLPVPVPAGYQFLAGVSLSTGGQTLTAPAALTWASPTNPTGNGMIWVEVAELGGVLRARFVGPARYDGPRLLVETTPAAAHNLPVPGVVRGGTYALLRSVAPLAYVKGKVLDVGSAPVPNALVWQDGTSIVAVSTATGDYALPAPAAGATVRSQRPDTGNAGSVAVPSQAAGAVATRNIQLVVTAPFVTSVAPTTATLLPQDLPVVFNLSEPLQPATVSGTSVTATVGSTPIPGTVRLSASGTQVTFTPTGLFPGRSTVRLVLSSLVTDAQGYRLVDAVTKVVGDYTATYTTVDPTPPSDINPLLIGVGLPSGTPSSVTIVGTAGAACPGCTVIAVNDTTTATSTTTALSNGSFSLTLLASLSDRISLTIRRPGGGEIRVNPGPFREDGGRTAYLSTQAADYITVDQVRVTLDAGTFSGPVTLKVKTIAQAALPAPVPSVSRYVAGIEFDPGAAIAGKPVDLSVPAPGGVTGGQFFVARAVSVAGETRWMVVDIARYDNGAITTRPAGAQQSAMKASFLLDAGDASKAAAPSGEPKALLDRVTKKSNLVFLEMTTLFNFIAGNIVHPNAAASFTFGSQYTFLAGFIPFIWVTGEARQQDYFVMPVPAGIPYTLRLFDASTGLTLFVGNFSGATDPTNVTAIPPGAISTNLPPPRLVAASPLTAHTFVPAPTVGAQKRLLAPGLEYDFIVDGQGRGTVNLRGLAGAVGGCITGKCAEVSMVNNTAAAGVPVLGAAAADGSFGTLAVPATSGDDLTFLAGTASLAPTSPLRVVLSQAVSAAELEASLELKDSDATVGIIAFEVVPDTQAPDPSRGFTINPASPFQSGHDITVTLRSDSTPRTVPKTLAIKLSAPRTDLIGPRDVTDVNALYLKGGLLLEATNTKLNLYDASDPGNVRACPPPITLSDQARGLTMDEHDRVLVSIGGGSTNGRVQVFRLSAYSGTGLCGGRTLLGEGVTPGALDRAWTEVTARLGSGQLGVLPEGYPRRLAILTRDSREEITLDSETGLPRYVTSLTKTDTTPADGKQDVGAPLGVQGQMPGTGVTPSPLNHPVTVANLTTGASWTAYADAAGNFSVTGVKASSGDRLEFVINAAELSIIGTEAFGLQGMDVNKTLHLFGQDCTGGGGNNICPEAKRLLFSQGTANPVLCKSRDGSGNCIDGFATLTQTNDIALLPAATTEAPGTPPDPLVLAAVSRYGLAAFSLVGPDEGIRLTQLGPGLPLTTFDNPPVYPVLFSVAAARGFPVKPVAERTFCDASLWPSGKPSLAFVASNEGVFVVDTTDASNPSLVGLFRVSATPGVGAHALQLDKKRGLLYVGLQDAIAAYDMSDPCTLNQAGRVAPPTDRRLIAKVTVTNQNLNVPFVLDADTGLIFGASDPTGGATVGKGFALSLFGPPLLFVADTDRKGDWEAVSQAIPLGVANPEKASAPNTPYRPDVVRVLAHLFGSLGNEVVVELSSTSSSGATLGEPPPGFPRTKTWVTLKRQSDNPGDPGYNRYLSAPIVLIADPRAQKKYTRLPAEEEPTAANESKDYACRNCKPVAGYDSELSALLTSPPAANDGEKRTEPIKQAFEQWTGEKLVVRLAETAAAESALKALASYLVPFDLKAVKGEIKTTRGDLAPALKQPPAQNASFFTTEAGVAIATNSGEVQTGWSDLAIKGRNLDFVLSRSYVSDVLHAGPFGRNQDSPLFARLRDLPSGDVDFYAGDGSRHTFKYIPDPDPNKARFQAPAGVFLDLYRLPDLTFQLLYPDQTRLFFDRDGRLTKLADRQTTAADGSDGNEMEFFYDGTGRLSAVSDATDRVVRFEYHPDTAPLGSRGLVSKVVDFDGREVAYTYTADAQLLKASGPDPSSPASEKPETTLAWSAPGAGALKEKLYKGGELLSATDGEARKVFDITYPVATPAVTNSVRQGGGTWQFSQSGLSSTVVDPNSNARIYDHETTGQAKSVTEPGGAVTAFAYDPDGEGRLTSLTRPMGGKVLYTYAAATPANSKLPMGNVLTVTEQPRPGSPEASAGQTLVTTIEYGAANLPKKLIAPDTATTTIARDTRGNPTTVTLPDNSTRVFAFDSRGQVTSSTDGIGVAETYTYFSSSDGRKEGYLKSRTVAGVATTTYQVDDRGNVTNVSDPGGRSAAYTVNKLDQAEEERQGVSQAKSIFNAAGQLVSRDVFTGNDTSSNPIYARTTYAIDEIGRLTTRTETGAGSAVASYTYDLAGNLKTVSRTAAPTTTFTYDNRDRVTAVAMGAATTRYGYDNDSVRTSVISPRNFTAAYLVDGFGRSIGSVDPTNVKVRELLDRAGRSTETRVTKVVGTTETLYRWTTRQFDPAGRVNREIAKLFVNPITVNADGTIPTAGVSDLVVQTTYNGAGSVLTVKDPLLRTTTNEYDGLGRLKKATDPVGNTVEYTYDASNNRTEEKVTELAPTGPPQVAVTKFEYDPQSRVTKLIDPLNQNTLYEYDPRGNQTKVTDVETRVTTSEYDVLGRKTKETDPNAGVTLYEYDLAGRLTALVDAKSNRTEFLYDVEGRLTEEKRADLKKWTSGYDVEGNRTSATDPNGTAVTTAFDPVSRPTGRTITRAAGVLGPTGLTFTLDPVGRIVGSTTSGDVAAVTEVFAYDSLDRLLREEQKIGSGANRVLTKAYDAASNITGLTYPSGLALTHVIDPLNRVAQIKQSATSIVTYRDVGARLFDKALSNGITQAWSYDPGRRLTQLLATKPGPTTVAQTTYTLSPLGNKREIARPDLGKKATYQFNPNSWITQEALNLPIAGGTPERQTDYTVDKVLNYSQVQERVNGTLTATKNQTINNRNQYTAFAGAALTYNPNGNVTGGAGLSGTTVQYDYENRLKKATKTDGTVVENLYDAQGRKVRESVTIGGTTTTRDYVLNGDQVIEQYAGTALSARYVHGRGIDETVRAELDVNVDGSLETTLFPLQDELGNVERLTDTAGATLERYDYQGYGKLRIFDPAGAPRSASSYGWKWLFQGREYQLQLQALDFRARTLWPELGRFGQEDPAGTEDSPNRYQAFLGNWPRFTDPTGLCADPKGPPGSVRICVDSFISTKYVPGFGTLMGALGDNRTFEAQGGPYFRARLELVVDARNLRFSRDPRGVANPSEVLGGVWPRDGYGSPIAGGAPLGKVFVIDASQEAYNGFADLPRIVPGIIRDPISYEITFYINRKGEVALSGGHDGYPSYEVWVYRDGKPPEELYRFKEKDIKLLAPPIDIPISLPLPPWAAEAAAKRGPGPRR